MMHEGRAYFRADIFRKEQNDELEIDQTLVSLNGEAHTRLRKLQRRGYSAGILDHRYPDLIQSVHDIVRGWTIGEPFLLKERMPRLVAELLGAGVLNYPVGEYLDDILIFVRTLVIETVARVRPRTVLNMPLYREAKRRVYELADRVIAYHRETAGEREVPDLVDDLLAADSTMEGLTSQQELRVGVLGAYIGGLDTVANTCCFMTYLVLRHPDIAEAIFAEVDCFFDAGKPAPEGLRALRTLNHTMLETLRMYPVSAAVQGTVSETFEFSGYRIEQGTNLIVATTVPHHLPECFRDPFKFDIGRYESPRNEHQKPGAFVPYGAGPHACLGARMAEVLIMLIMASLFRAVRLKSDPPDYELKIEAMPAPVPKDFYLRVVELRV
jgi:cytochrome P450